MDKEKLFTHLDRRYSSKRDMVSRIPLGVQPETLWRELLDRRKSRCTILPLYSHNGTPYWYVTTNKMVAASEKIIEELYENDTEFDPYTGVSSVSTLEEVFYTSYVEGAQLTMQAAMEFLTSGLPPRDIEEQLITNNRQAGSYAAGNLYRTIDKDFLRELAYILTDGMDNGGQDYRATDEADYISPEGETYTFPSAHLIPERVNELCAFLASGETHPLIKASAAQAYILILRPFQEGNERLSRILSSMILLRAGYTFFADVSLSALIARRSYAYFEAVANIMREENGGDITYFLEYFLELLSRAVDERRLRIRQREERDRQNEREMARTTLTAPTEQLSTELSEQHMSSLPIREDEVGEDFFTEAQTDEIDLSDDETDLPDKEIRLARVRDKLYQYATGDGQVIKKVANLLLEFMEEKIDRFTSEDIEKTCSLTAHQTAQLITYLKENGIVEGSDKRIGKYILYHFGMSLPPLETKDYAPEILEMIDVLRDTHTGDRDKRSGEIISRCIPKGIITIADYRKIGNLNRMRLDMMIPEQMGIVKKISAGVYRICRERMSSTPYLRKGQKFILTALYKAFHKEWFIRTDAMAALNMTRSVVNNALHLFRMLRIVEYCDGWTHTYRLLVNPAEHPSLFNGYELSENEVMTETDTALSDSKPAYSKEIYDLIDKLTCSETSQADRRTGESIQRCLSKGRIDRGDYEKWGYSINMWNYDIALAKHLGLVSKIGKGRYALNRELSPVPFELTPTQRKTITGIYETFGDQKFSPEMYIATLDYSPSHIYASLHKLTLMRVLDKKTTEEGKQYQLLVNPRENPEYFDMAA